ncbi:ABC-type transport auxiliary lipoprotein family protein [Paraglaciecola sp.]|uniref:PqiC family protein n=1 Tax=Paraglaciecola sp. TaxID=1920173 RepID=UPI0030F41732
MKHLLLSLLVAGLSACSSKPLDVNYYVLSPPQPVLQSNQNNYTKQVKLNKILLADYLRQSSIALQVDDNKMHFSRQDVWAESLDMAILNALLMDLNQNTNTSFSSYLSPDNQADSTTLTLQIEHFHATDKSTVVSSGRYWLFDPVKQQKFESPFYFSLSLQQDGYSHAISQQRQLIRLLADKIQLDLAKFDKMETKNRS